MIFNVSGGGGTALNFRVVGGTAAPANPAENCIWVNTETPITSWLFSATEPSPAEAGMVWISTGISSPGAFNVLKKNGIRVYPIAARQYIGGAWVIKTAKSYQGGAEVNWFDGVIFRNGAKNDHITGGWTGYTSGTVLTVNKSNSPQTKNLVDFTGFKKLYATFATVTRPTDGAGNAAGSYGIGVFLDRADGTSVVSLGATSPGTLSVDISSVNEPMRITGYAHQYNQGGSGTISEIWFE